MEGRSSGRRPRSAAWLLAAALVGAIAPAGVEAQLAWETPRLLGPESPMGFGVHWLRAGTLPGDGDAALVTLRLPGLPEGVRLRGGGGRGVEGELAGFGGIDVRRPLARHTDAQPLDVAWIAGLGLGVGQYVLATLPLGLTAGRAWSSGSVWLAPYVGVGLALDLRLGSEAPEKEFDAAPSAELGVDLSLDPGRRFVLRAAASLGDRQAFAVGLAIGAGR